MIKLRLLSGIFYVLFLFKIEHSLAMDNGQPSFAMEKIWHTSFDHSARFNNNQARVHSIDNMWDRPIKIEESGNSETSSKKIKHKYDYKNKNNDRPIKIIDNYAQKKKTNNLLRQPQPREWKKRSRYIPKVSSELVQEIVSTEDNSDQEIVATEMNFEEKQKQALRIFKGKRLMGAYYRLTNEKRVLNRQWAQDIKFRDYDSSDNFIHYCHSFTELYPEQDNSDNFKQYYHSFMEYYSEKDNNYEDRYAHYETNNDYEDDDADYETDNDDEHYYAHYETDNNDEHRCAHYETESDDEYDDADHDADNEDERDDADHYSDNEDEYSEERDVLSDYCPENSDEDKSLEAEEKILVNWGPVEDSMLKIISQKNYLHGEQKEARDYIRKSRKIRQRNELLRALDEDPLLRSYGEQQNLNRLPK